MSATDTITVIVAALNEERNLEAAVDAVLPSVARWFDDYEILIFNDGSTDGTGEVAERIAAGNRAVRVFHNAEPRCLGWVFKEGVRRARMEYVILVNGKNDMTTEALDAILSLHGKADMVVPYTENLDDRPAVRRLLSRAFTALLNTAFRLDLRYYNHSVLHKRSVVSAIAIRTNSYAFQAEALIKAIGRGCSYVEVGVRDTFHAQARTKSFRLDNVLGVARFLPAEIWNSYRGGNRR